MNFNRIPFRNKAVQALIVIASTALPTAVLADQVTLKSSDGTLNIVGEFIEYADDAYLIRTDLGELRISASRVRCEGDACPVFETAEADVVIAGSDTVGLGLMPLLMQGFAGSTGAEASVIAMQKESEMLANFVGDDGFGEDEGTYLIQSTVSGDAFKALKSGTAQIGMASRRIKPEEARALKAAGAGNMVHPKQEHIVAIEAMVVVNHPENPVETISTEQLRDIYAGKITNWSELGGPDMEIKVGTRAQGSGTLSVFKSKLGLDGGDELAADAFVAESHNEMANYVTSDPAAIGFVGYAFMRGAKPVTLISSCGISMEPDAFTAKTEEYALNRRLYLYNTTDSLTDKAQDFINFLNHQDSDEVVEKAGFISLGIQTQKQEMTSARARALLNPDVDAFEGGVMREMLGSMLDYDRLSTTFRFRTGSSRLDERGLEDLGRLTAYLEGKPEGTKVMLVGFTDDVGAFESNRRLSQKRATQVEAAVRDFAGERLAHINFDTSGYGPISPAFCNDDDNGRAINRRVEVWIGKDAVLAGNSN